MPLPLYTPPSSLSSEPLLDSWSGLQGVPDLRSRIPTSPPLDATFFLAPPSVPSFTWSALLNAGNFSEFTSTQGSLLKVIRGWSKHQTYSIEARPTTKASVSEARITRVGLNSTSVRVFIGVEPSAEFGPGDGIAILDIGDGISQAVELSLFNDRSVKGPPELQLITRTGGVNTVRYISNTFVTGYPVYVELFFKRSATTRVTLWHDPIGTGTPAFDLSGFTTTAANTNHTRFGVLRNIGKIPAHNSVFFSSILGKDNQAGGVVIGPNPSTTPPAITEGNATHGSPACLVGDVLWYINSSPYSLRSRNLISPNHNPADIEPASFTPQALYNPPVHIDGYIIWPVSETSAPTHVYVIRAGTGSIKQVIDIPQITSDWGPIPFNHGAVILSTDGHARLIDPHPLTPFVRTDADVRVSATVPTKIVNWPLPQASFLTTTIVGSTPAYCFLNENLQLIQRFDIGAPDQPYSPQIVLPDGSTYSTYRTSGGLVDVLLHHWGDFTKLGSTPPTPSRFTPPSPEYALSFATNPNAVTSRRRPVMSAAPTFVAFATASPAFATNAQAQSIFLYARSYDLQTALWKITLCSNLSGNTANGCELGGIQTDESGFVFATYKYHNAGGTPHWYMRVFRAADGSAATAEIEVPGPGPYPMPSTDQAQLLRYASVESGVTVERFLNPAGLRTLADVRMDVSDHADTSQSGLLTGPLERAPLPLSPAALEPGGTLEILEKQGGELVRVAMVSDLFNGVSFTKDLTNLDTITFSVPYDRFVPLVSGAGSMRELQRQWMIDRGENTTNGRPYDKVSQVRDNVYVFYFEPSGRLHPFRMSNLVSVDSGNLTGTAIDASIELADVLTQYVAGRSQFSGLLPSEIATRVLKGHQSVAIQNRRFVRDSPVRMQSAEDIPDMTPADWMTTKGMPLPFVTEIPALNPDDAALFSGLPQETVPPHGTTRALPSGSFGLMGWNDSGSVHYPKYETLVAEKIITPGIAGTVGMTTRPLPPLGAPENANYNSNVIYGAVKATSTGTWKFLFGGINGGRVYFKGKLVGMGPGYTGGPQQIRWEADMIAGRWYPYVFHQFWGGDVAANFDQGWTFSWQPPGGSMNGVPTTSSTSALFGGLFLVRFVDVQGSQRYMMAYKRWDGRAIVLAFPLPRSVHSPAVIATGVVQSDWPKMLPAGALIEEVLFPADPTALSAYPNAQVLSWGTGWTRRPGPRSLNLEALEVAKFQHRAENY